MHSLLSIYVPAKSAISECFKEIPESFPILSQKATKPAEFQRILYNHGAQNKTPAFIVSTKHDSLDDRVCIGPGYRKESPGYGQKESKDSLMRYIVFAYFFHARNHITFCLVIFR